MCKLFFSCAPFLNPECNILPGLVFGGQVTILVANTGGQSGSYQVVLRINSMAAADREVALDAGASEQVSFSTARDTAGTYSVNVNGLTGAFVVKEKPAPVTPVEPTPVNPIIWWLIGGIIAAVVVVALLIFRSS